MELCIALDLPSASKNLRLAERFAEHDLWVKVGLRSYIRDGRAFLDTLRSINPNFKIFLDLKLYDIPNTMADAAEVIAELEIDMFNIHASAGRSAMESVMQRLAGVKRRPLVLAVTALTSFDERAFRQIYGSDIRSRADLFASEAYGCGLDGVVCSVFESLDIKRATSQDFLTLCPGIRPYGEDSGDQHRVADLKTAALNMADYIVVGRPVYNDRDPSAKIKNIIRDIEALDAKDDKGEF